ncbi:hypothetical protein FO488_05940 [Geobacter sp. FeAm09]|uniref:transporter substrate-binding domain-containing protein n=1 Tax=Geobacter sp. FeAm09 TaxID=2597769 RepID=UPI0011EBAECF|nr:transporter substrate-binding domain-containing protein [Geobacter sp. FeAm09]QEM67739.1 hypothetical protein FO488_05940 [Geobacter sp. FeAm09]
MKRITLHLMVGICVMAILVASPVPRPSEAAEKIVLVSSQETRESFYGRWLDLIYTEAFRRLGYEFRYKGYPGGRAPVMAERGEVDGEIHRPADYEKVARNLLKVKEPSFSVSYVAYAARQGIVLNGWASLKNTDYAVEYRRGAKVPEAALPAVVRPERLSSIATPEQGLKKLITGRTDIYVDQEAVVTEALGRLGPSPVHQVGVMFTGYTHVFLHKKHAALVPKVALVLKAMKREGLIKRYRQLALEQQPGS